MGCWQMGILMSLTRRRVLLAITCTGWSDHERVPFGPPAWKDVGGLPQLQVPGSPQLQLPHFTLAHPLH